MDVVQAGETVLFRLNDDTTFFSVVDSKTYVRMAIPAPSFARMETRSSTIVLLVLWRCVQAVPCAQEGFLR